MARISYPVRAAVLCLLIVRVSAAQEAALERAKRELALLRQAPVPRETDHWNKADRDRSAGLQAAVRDWIESLLPKSRTVLDAGSLFFRTKLETDLHRAKLTGSDDTAANFTPGLVSRIELSRPPEDLDKLVITIGVRVPCGEDDVVYIYDYSQGEPRRVLESHSTREHDESVPDVRISKRDRSGNRLILTLRYGVQCGSSWNMLSYDLFRLPADSSSAVPILGGEHGIWLGAYDPYRLRLDPDELLIEVRGRSIDSSIHNRVHVLHFKAAGPWTERIDPVALQPQDFVEEWLTRPWSEMDSRSAEGEGDKLRMWHEFLAGDSVAGDFQFVQRCSDKTGQWQVGIDLNWIQGKELPEGLRLYFLVQELDLYRFRMVGIGFDRQEGCPGESQPSRDSPTLFSSAGNKP